MGVALALAGAFLDAATEEPLRLLLFSKTAAYRHEAIPDGIAALEAIGNELGWSVAATEDAGAFEEPSLSGFDVIVFLLTTGDVLDDAQQTAFAGFIGRGKGFVGIHSASDTEHDWPWYGDLVGAYFRSHPEVQEASYVVEDRSHPATRHLPERWVRLDEHYNFDRNPRARGATVLVSLDEASYAAGEGAMGDHPVVWFRERDGGRAFYTALGHTRESYSDPLFRRHLAGAISWAARRSLRGSGSWGVRWLRANMSTAAMGERRRMPGWILGPRSPSFSP